MSLYLGLNLFVLGIGVWFVVIAVAMIVQQIRKGHDPGRWLLWRYLITLIILLAFTAIFDNAIVGAGIVEYDPSTITGIYVGVVPIEDFAYSVAAVLILPTLWGVLGYFKKDPAESVAS